MEHKLPELPYSLEALNPHISKQTLEFHHGKHHLNYVNTLNKLIPGTRFENASLEDMIREADGAIFNNAAQVWNHTFYFDSFSPKPKVMPEGGLLEALNRDFGSFDKFLEEFGKSALGLGWPATRRGSFLYCRFPTRAIRSVRGLRRSSRATSGNTRTTLIARTAGRITSRISGSFSIGRTLKRCTQGANRPAYQGGLPRAARGAGFFFYREVASWRAPASKLRLLSLLLRAVESR